MDAQEVINTLQNEIDNFPTIWYQGVQKGTGRYYQMTIDIHPQFAGMLCRLIKRSLDKNYPNVHVTFEWSRGLSQAYQVVDMFNAEGWN